MKLNSEKAREMGRLSGQARRNMSRSKRGLRLTLLEFLASDGGDILSDTPPRTLTAGEILARGLIRQAIEGNIKAAEFIRDTIGEKPGAKNQCDQPDNTRNNEIVIKVVE